MMNSYSSSSATVAVEKATSDLLVSPDWTMNIEICDSIDSNHCALIDATTTDPKRGQGGDHDDSDRRRNTPATHRHARREAAAVVTVAAAREWSVRRDLCTTVVARPRRFDGVVVGRFWNSGDGGDDGGGGGDYNDSGGDGYRRPWSWRKLFLCSRYHEGMQVRDKILILLDLWQEAFGGSGGKHPQYYRACKELKQYGVVFPKRTPDAAAIFTPPSTHPTSRNMPAGYWMASNSSKTLDETMATEIESLSMPSLDSMRYALDLLSDMLQAANPSDRAAVKEEVIIDLVDRCRTNQKKLMQMLTTTGDEELLGQGLELNDITQSLLARHDAIASGTPFPIQGASSNTVPNEAQCSLDQSNICSSSPGKSSSSPKATYPGIVFSDTRSQSDDEEDEFAQLLRSYVVPWAQNQSQSEFQTLPQDQTYQCQSQTPSPPSSPHTHYEAQQHHHQPAQQEQLQPQTLPQPQHVFQQPQYHHQYSPHQQHLQPPSEPQPLQYQPQYQTPEPRSQCHPQPQLQYQPQTMHGHQPQPQQQFQNQHLQYPSRYPPPPWAATPGYANYQNHSPAANVISTEANTTVSYSSAPGVMPVLHNNSFPDRVDTNGKVKMTSSSGSSSNLSGTMGPGMVGGRK
ncbi:hypothetical protein LR48_Vigan03g079800 [Vigna angularis]|uniref:GAT domain-containing protein n=1 Tax=Phaseolus angularis TaxID=3914 RepID=A0A0L9U3Q5_PHAAN|nr:hypothetical protein LR48_Vigan03g079800 [Vigna angularis]